MRTCIKACMNLNLGHLRLLTTELAALERLKFQTIVLLPRKRLQFCWDILFIAGYKDSHEFLNEFEIQTDPTIDWGVSCP